MENINIAQLLEDCPKGMDLYSPLCGECKLDEVMQGIIHVRTYSNTLIAFYSNGRYIQDGECVLFPSKENRDWSTFKPPFKDGDILSYKFSAFENRSIYIYKQHNEMNTTYYVALSGCDDSELLISDKEVCALNGYNSSARLATEEEKQKLFNAIKANGYKWNAETKTLEKLIKPKFDVGDKVKNKDGYVIDIIEVDIINEKYTYKTPLGAIGDISFYNQNKYELVHNKFDITTLKPFDKVLVRDNENCLWNINFYSFYNKPYFMTMHGLYAQCIPYNDNTKHLLETDNDCDNYYKNW